MHFISGLKSVSRCTVYSNYWLPVVSLAIFWKLKFREVYHTKRMQHVICIKWSADNKYILSGSDEMNIRLWKANAAEKLGVVSLLSSSLHYSYWFHIKGNLLLLGNFSGNSSSRCLPASRQLYFPQLSNTLYLSPSLYYLFYELAGFFDTAVALRPPSAV